MNEFKFNCPYCQQPLEAMEDMLGERFPCPSCKGLISLPAPASEVVHRPSVLPVQQIKICPFCSEEIFATAMKCKHCGEYLNRALREAMTLRSTPTPHVVRTTKSRFIYIILGILLGGLGIHNLYAGRYSSAVAQFILTMIFMSSRTEGVLFIGVWILIELFAVTKDGNGIPLT